MVSHNRETIDELMGKLAAMKDVEVPSLPPAPPLPPLPPFRPDDGGGNHGGMEEWKASVDRQLSTLHDDVRALLKAIIGAAALAVGVLAGLYFYTGGKVDGLQRQISGVQTEQARIAGDVSTRDARLNGKIDVLLDRKK